MPLVSNFLLIVGKPIVLNLFTVSQEIVMKILSCLVKVFHCVFISCQDVDITLVIVCLNCKQTLCG